jgi:hypothetical protein
VGKVAGCSKAGNPILEGSNWRNLGVPGVEGVDDGVVWHLAVS